MTEKDNVSPENTTGGLIGFTENDAQLQLQIINNTFALFREYHHRFGENNKLKNLFGIDSDNPTKLTISNELPSVLKDIKKMQDDGFISKLRANDFSDLLKGYAAAIVSPNPIRVSYATENEETKEKELHYDRAELSGGGEFNDKSNENTGILEGDTLFAIKNEDGEPKSIMGDDFTLMELSAHEVLGHAAGHSFQVEDHKGLEAVKYESIVRRLEERGPRDYSKYPHKTGREDRIAELGSDLQKAKEALADHLATLLTGLTRQDLIQLAEQLIDPKRPTTTPDYVTSLTGLTDPTDIEKIIEKVKATKKIDAELKEEQAKHTDIQVKMEKVSNWKYADAVMAGNNYDWSAWEPTKLENSHIVPVPTRGMPEENFDWLRPTISNKRWEEVEKLLPKADNQQYVFSSENLFPPAPVSVIRSIEERLFAAEDTEIIIPPIRIDNKINIVRNITGNIPASMITRKKVEELLVEMLSRADRTAGGFT